MTNIALFFPVSMYSKPETNAIAHPNSQVRKKGYLYDSPLERRGYFFKLQGLTPDRCQSGEILELEEEATGSEGFKDTSVAEGTNPRVRA